MLELKKITKVYEMPSFNQTALNNIDISFRKNEFVAILGQSGSGKTTLLNIIGGLDGYTSGDLIVNGVSTMKYLDRDWDTYRNHRIGFIFQSYNLISHQTILSNVELALTLSGVSRKERKRRAKEALEKVGLAQHINKRPNQLSGGQMQRVAIARALINNPEIILADEPTGALDSETSLQIMELLKDIAKDRLVIMVTHNPELANNYATRIVELQDGEIINDTKPFDSMNELDNKHVKKKKKSMSFKTAFGLSLNNLLTKKGRTILTAFAGSIGIIGIAVILSISTGVQNYIDKTEEETLSSYPITIEESTIDFSSFMDNNGNNRNDSCAKNKICSNNIMGDLLSATTSSKISNNLYEFKNYLETNKDIKNKVNDIKYHYGFDLLVYTSDYVNVNPNMLAMKMMGNSQNSMVGMSSMMSTNQNVFTELLDNERLLESQYEVLKGRFPKEYNEIVLIVDENNKLSDYVMYSIGLLDQKEIMNIQQSIINGKEFDNKVVSYSFDEILNYQYKLVLNSSLYRKENGVWVNKSTDVNFLKKAIDNGINLKIVGILKPSDDSVNALNNVVGYTKDLVKYVIDENNKRDVVKQQMKKPSINVFTGKDFDGIEATYDNNMRLLGVANQDKPVSIDIYPKSFEDKEAIKSLINEYNDSKKNNNNENDVITYTDYVGLLMDGITSIIDVITIVLIGFVAVSLVVSSIMIAIITYISVLERTKEIGILRAIGASKKDVSRVFNAETFIEGLIAGVMGIVVTLLINWPINVIVSKLASVNNIAKLNPVAAVILVLISVFLTVIAGFVPAKMASRRNPVESLRTD